MGLWQSLCNGMYRTPPPPPVNPAPPKPGTGPGPIPQTLVAQPEILPQSLIPTPLTFAYYNLVPPMRFSPIWTLKPTTITDPKFNLMGQHNMPTNQFLTRPSRDVLVLPESFQFYQGPYVPGPNEQVW